MAKIIVSCFSSLKKREEERGKRKKGKGGRKGWRKAVREEEQR